MPASDSKALNDIFAASVEQLAQRIYETRLADGKSGTAEQDWAEAEALYNTLHEGDKELELSALPEDRNPKGIEAFFRDRRTSYLPRLSAGLGKLAVTSGCAAAVMSLLTGEHPMYIRARQKVAGVTNAEVVVYLKNHGFEVTKLTSDILKPETGVMTKFVRATNVLLLKLQVAKGENSWALFWGGMLIHNWEFARVDAMTFVNHQVVDSYLIWHASWESDRATLHNLRKSFPDKEKLPAEKTAEATENEYRDIGLAQAMFGTTEGLTNGPDS